MNTKYQHTIDGYANGLTKISNLLAAVDVPDCLSLIFNCDGQPELYTFLSRCSDGEERDRVLTLCGEAFGRSGWVATQTSITEWKWTKEVMGVNVEISGAKRLPEPTPSPVLPQEFPLQLTAPSV